LEISYAFRKKTIVKIWHILVKEILHRWRNFALGIFAVIVAVGSLTGALTLLKVHDLHTQKILTEKEQETEKKMAILKDEMRKATLKLSFNLLILPKQQSIRELHIEGCPSEYMPEEYAARLANSGIITVRHFLPSLQQRIKWPEKKRTITLVGTRGEVPNLHKDPRKPLVQPVPEGNIVLGYGLHQSLGLQVGDKVKLLGREFIVHKCYKERGSKDDFTAWIHLRQAQELLDKEGLINAILALECLCQGVEDLLGMVRKEIEQILPGTQVIEKGTKALARAESRVKVGQEAKAAVERERRHRTQMRSEREFFAAVLVPLVMVACAVWIGLLAFNNVRDRKIEIGIQRAMGFRARQIMFLFLSKFLVMGLLGGALGIFAGLAFGRWLGLTLEKDIGGIAAGELFNPGLLLLALIIAPMLTVISAYLPTVVAIRQDPAEVLKEE
jgi:putative ABC transport system permease protein